MLHLQHCFALYILVLIGNYFTCCESWITDRDSNFAGGWRAIRRSRNCYGTNEECLQTSQCCSDKEICLLDRRQSMFNGREVGKCMNIDQHKKITKNTKKEGERCQDSYDCGIGLCCRSILLYRYGSVQKCGKSEGPYMCISKEEDLYDAIFDRYE